MANKASGLTNEREQFASGRVYKIAVTDFTQNDTSGVLFQPMEDVFDEVHCCCSSSVFSSCLIFLVFCFNSSDDLNACARPARISLYFGQSKVFRKVDAALAPRQKRSILFSAVNSKLSQ